MKEELNQLKTLTIASLKMYYRNKSAVFFSFFIPVLIILIFGLVLHDSSTTFNLGIVDNPSSNISKEFITTLDKTKAFKITKGSQANELKALKEGNEDVVLIIPQSFSINPSSTSQITAYYDKAKAQNAQVAILIIQNVLNRYNNVIYSSISGEKVPIFISILQKGIQTNNLNQIDFLIPGMIGFSIMQLGIFSVAFAFTTMKKTGALRRLQATPARPSNFIIAQSITRLILAVIQVGILLGLGLVFFNLHMYGNIFSFFIFVFLGSIVFLAIGFAVAGYSKDENQAAPIANIITLPMTFLSGVFFPRSLMPPVLQTITSVLPLSYLNDALREIANSGASILSLKSDLIGLLIWCVLGMIIAVKLFKWE